MRAGVLVVMVCGCNQVYGLDPTQLPPPDAPHACPEIGGPAPVFSRGIYQALTQPSTSYHFNASGTLAVAATYDGIYVGRVGEELTLSTELVPEYPYVFYDPHPSPDGERLYVQVTYEDYAALESGIAMYERTGSTWRYVENLPYDLPWKGNLSTVFRGHAGDRVIFTGTTMLEEYERVGGVWTPQGTPQPRSELQIDPLAKMALTSDGLRAVFRGGTTDNMQMMYSDRPNLESWFRAPQPLEGVPKVVDAQFTDDCARIYYNGLNAVFYSQQ